MTSKFKDLNSLKFPEVKDLLERICKVLNFKFVHTYCYSPVKKDWLLVGDDGEIIFLDVTGKKFAQDRFQTAKALLEGILNTKIFKLRSIKSYDEKIIQNPFYLLDLSRLNVMLDLI